MSAMASQITSVSIVYSAICSDADHQSSVSLAYVRGIHDVIMKMTEKKLIEIRVQAKNNSSCMR